MIPFFVHVVQVKAESRSVMSHYINICQIIPMLENPEYRLAIVLGHWTSITFPYFSYGS